MLEIGKTYRVKTLKDFKKMNVSISFYDNSLYSVDNFSVYVTIHHMCSVMTALKKVTIKKSIELGYYKIEEDDCNWEPWMLVDPKEFNTIMETE